MQQEELRPYLQCLALACIVQVQQELYQGESEAFSGAEIKKPFWSGSFMLPQKLV